MANRSTYITSTARIPILEPRSSDVVVLLINGHLQVLHRFLGLLQEVDSRCASSHEDYTHFAPDTEWFFADSVASGVDFWDMEAVSLGGDVVELIDMVTGSGGVAWAVVVYHHLEIDWDVKV
jgi:hypothetical protein